MNPIDELKAFLSYRRRKIRWLEKRVSELTAKRDADIFHEQGKLSPSAARMLVAHDGEMPERLEPDASTVRLAAIEDAADSGYDDADPNPAPDWLNKEPAPLPAGALLEVADKPRKRA